MRRRCHVRRRRIVEVSDGQRDTSRQFAAAASERTMARTGASRRAGASTSARPGAAGSTGHEGRAAASPPAGHPGAGTYRPTTVPRLFCFCRSP